MRQKKAVRFIFFFQFDGLVWGHRFVQLLPALHVIGMVEERGSGIAPIGPCADGRAGRSARRASSRSGPEAARDGPTAEVPNGCHTAGAVGNSAPHQCPTLENRRLPGGGVWGRAHPAVWRSFCVVPVAHDGHNILRSDFVHFSLLGVLEWG